MTPEDIAAARKIADDFEGYDPDPRIVQALTTALDEVERAQRIEAQAISAMNAAHAAARASEAEIAALRDRVAELVARQGIADRAVDVLEDQCDQLVALVREFAAAMPDRITEDEDTDYPSRGMLLEVTREDLPSLFLDEDGHRITVAQAKGRLFAKLPMVASP